MKFIILVSLLFNFSYALDFFVIPVTDNIAFNYFFSFPVWITIVSIPVMMSLTILKHIK
ncbi:putative membrane protein [Sulfurospirillum multivorans DSM 12446]|uniref:Membrane protein n=1 Tax=Sulfurospirillum multivorans (strain DM 12446 / JCM 15788 / NBRC 109480) TaxID=1150621 RepID=A0AA86AL18_SULMK|nr:putative membrane protein [Sulfurospirillum multivorans DSM 12446]